jgi:hypothetical protein
MKSNCYKGKLREIEERVDHEMQNIRVDVEAALRRIDELHDYADRMGMPDTKGGLIERCMERIESGKKGLVNLPIGY